MDRGAYASGSAPKNALVVFDTPASAALAVKQMDGMKMRSNKLVVQRVGGSGGNGGGGRAAPGRPY